jgi:hypothetical protein
MIVVMLLDTDTGETLTDSSPEHHAHLAVAARSHLAAHRRQLGRNGAEVKPALAEFADRVRRVADAGRHAGE